MPDRGADDALRQIEAAGAAREVGDHQRHHHAEHRGRDAVEHLDGHQQIGIGHDREQEAADRAGRRMPHQQERPAPPDLRLMPTHGEISATISCGTTMQAAISTVAHSARPRGQDAAHQRQHRGIGEVEQQHAARRE